VLSFWATPGSTYLDGRGQLTKSSSDHKTRVDHASRQRNDRLAVCVRAQQGKRMRRVGVLSPLSANDPQEQVRNAAFLQGLQQFGWTVGNNVQIDYRWSAGNEDDTRKYALELVALAPDVIFATGSGAVGILQLATHTVPPQKPQLGA
jgi:hypothetical protein